jgi:hypothetical protein
MNGNGKDISSILTDAPTITQDHGMPTWGIGVLVIAAVFIIYWFFDKFKSSAKENKVENTDQQQEEERGE